MIPSFDEAHCDASDAPVRCVCGNTPTACWFGNALAQTWCVMCRACKREGGCRTTRADALDAWADETRDRLDKIIHGRA